MIGYYYISKLFKYYNENFKLIRCQFDCEKSVFNDLWTFSEKWSVKIIEEKSADSKAKCPPIIHLVHQLLIQMAN